MKKLTKIRLINWHYLTNETINVHDHVLLTGPNASGKSTIMDAIMYVVTAGDTNFNMAANEKSKRDLRGYVKCKLGLDDKEYLRDGDVTGHIALEFHDEKLNSDFTVGVVIDAFGELMPVKTLFYKVDRPIEDDWFVSEQGMIYSTVVFRKNHPDFEFYLTKKEAKRAFRNAFGSINEDFFKLIPKALAFKPIADVKDFIYQNVLEENYKELEDTLKLIKTKINDLKEITSIHQELEKIIENKNYVEYLDTLFAREKVNYDIAGKFIFAPDNSSEFDNDEWKIGRNPSDYIEISEITDESITIHKKQGFASQIILELSVKKRPSITKSILIDCNPSQNSSVLTFNTDYQKVNIAYINYNESVTFDNTTSYIDESGLFTNEVDFENVKLEFGYSINSINQDLIPEEYYNPTLRYIGGKDFIDLFSGTNLYNDEYFKLATDNVKLSDFLNTQSNNGLTLLNGGVIDTNFLEEIFANSTNFNLLVSS